MTENRPFYVTLILMLIILLPNNMVNGQSVGDKLPYLWIPDENGNVRSFAEMRGKYVYLVYWASWCENSSKAIFEAKQLQKSFGNQPFIDAVGFDVFSISLDNNSEDWQNSSKQNGINWKYNFLEPKNYHYQTVEKMGISHTPSSFLISPKGEIIGIDMPVRDVQYFLENKLGINNTSKSNEIRTVVFNTPSFADTLEVKSRISSKKNIKERGFYVVLGVFNSYAKKYHKFDHLQIYGEVNTESGQDIDGSFRPTLGSYHTYYEAKNVLEDLKDLGYKDATIAKGASHESLVFLPQPNSKVSTWKKETIGEDQAVFLEQIENGKHKIIRETVISSSAKMDNSFKYQVGQDFKNDGIKEENPKARVLEINRRELDELEIQEILEAEKLKKSELPKSVPKPALNFSIIQMEAAQKLEEYKNKTFNNPNFKSKNYKRNARTVEKRLTGN